METTAHIKTLRLSQLTGSIERMFEKFFDDKTFWVEGDITDYNYYRDTRRRYFSVTEKDKTSNKILAKVSAVVWESGADKISHFEKVTGQKFQNNIHVLLKVSVNYHSTFGLKLSVVDISIEYTIGRLENMRQQTLQRLLTDCAGFVKKVEDVYLTANKSIKLNAVIQRIAVVTSSVSAGYEDFKHTIDTNPFGYRFHIDSYYTTVQGELNAESICQKLTEVCESKVNYDAVVITRGGGAQTDFLIFEHYELCKQVACFPFPVITGIGHQKNETIVDLMAHTSTKTPTKAAELIIAHNREFENRLLDVRNNIIIKTQSVQAIKKNKLSALHHTLVNKSRDIIIHHKEEFSYTKRELLTAVKEVLHKENSALQTTGSNITSKPKLILSYKSNDLANISNGVKHATSRYFLKSQSLTALSSSIIANAQKIVQKGKQEGNQISQVITNKTGSILNRNKMDISSVANQILYKGKSISGKGHNDLYHIEIGIRTNTDRFLLDKERHLDNYISILRVLSPANILKRGFAIIFHDGQIVTAGENIPDGSEIKIRFEDAEVNSITTNKIKLNGTEFDI